MQRKALPAKDWVNAVRDARPEHQEAIRHEGIDLLALYLELPAVEVAAVPEGVKAGVGERVDMPALSRTAGACKAPEGRPRLDAHRVAYRFAASRTRAEYHFDKASTRAGWRSCNARSNAIDADARAGAVSGSPDCAPRAASSR